MEHLKFNPLEKSGVAQCIFETIIKYTSAEINNPSLSTDVAEISSNSLFWEPFGDDYDNIDWGVKI